VQDLHDRRLLRHRVLRVGRVVRYERVDADLPL
jgi:hypothetical protein